jgi:hypothetical protein
MTQTTQVPLEPGQTVVLGVGAVGHERWSRTSVAHIDARMVWLDAAPEGQPSIDAQPGTEVVCHTWRNMDALYRVRARVGMCRLAPEPLVGLLILESRRIQKREYVRVPLSTDARVYFGGPSTSDETANSFGLRVQDLSAGGLRGRTERSLTAGDELTIDLPLPDAPPPLPPTSLILRGRVVALHDLPEPLNLRARIVRQVETGLPEDALSCEIGVAFLDVAKEVRERIIRFALRVQHDRRRRGML